MPLVLLIFLFCRQLLYFLSAALGPLCLILHFAILAAIWKIGLPLTNGLKPAAAYRSTANFSGGPLVPRYKVRGAISECESQKGLLERAALQWFMSAVQGAAAAQAEAN